MAPTKRPSLMVPATEEAASLSLILEALRGLNERIESQNSASAEDRKLLHDIHIRMVRLESNRLETRVEALQREVDELKTERDRRDGAVGALEWISKFGPWLVALFATIAAIVGWDRAAS